MSDYRDTEQMDQNINVPTGKIKRALVGGGTAAKVGGKALSYYAKRPFMGTEAKQKAKDRMIRDSAQTLFQGLSLLKGTALKLAQLLSFEMDLFPEVVCRELSKAYHQVPPINRALVRKAVFNALGKPSEKVFKKFDLNSFAAASIGQVHSAVSHDSTSLAVKIQYPGIASTIDSDISLLRQVLRPVIQNDQLLPLIKELSERLREEVDYCQEAEHIIYFSEHLKIEGVKIPQVKKNLSSDTLLTTTKLPGTPLDQWLKKKPDQDAIDQVAQVLYQIFITGLYDLHVIHADPNPGNFIIADDLTVGLVDFGCIKKLDVEFVENYRTLAISAAHQRDNDHCKKMMEIGLLAGEYNEDILVKLKSISNAFSIWFSRPFAKEFFDFKCHPEFITQGKEVMKQFHHLRRHMKINPDFIFLDRTRYGLLRLFEQMGARICFRNDYEWER